MKTKHSRRAFLGGAGACLSLPFLQSLAPQTVQAQGPMRIITIVFPHGVRPETWHSSGSGSSWSLSRDLAPLARHKAKLVSIGGLDRSEPAGGGDHPRGFSSVLTGADINPGSRRAGVSFDQLAAAHLGSATPRVPSLTMAAEGQGFLGGDDAGYPTYLGSYLSWRDADNPVPPMMNTGAIFDRLFSGFEPGASMEVADVRYRRDSSLLDYVNSDLISLNSQLSRKDRQTLDQYTTSLRELEMGLVETPMEIPACEIGERTAHSGSYPQRMDQMLQLMTMAARCDITRIMTLNLGDTYSQLRVREFGVPSLAGVRNEGLHDVSHHSEDELALVNQWWATKVAGFLDDLDSIEEPGGTALDNSVVLFTSEIGDAPVHGHTNLPVLLAGSAGGRIETDRRINAGSGTPMANLFLALLNKAGVDVGSFGNSRGPLAGL